MRKWIKSNLSVWMAGMFIAGSAIGAGILALPIQTGIAGFIPSLICLPTAALAMFSTGYFIAEKYLESDDCDKDFLSIYINVFGSSVKYFLIPLFVLLLYGVLIAFLTAGGAILAHISPVKIPGLIYILIFFIPCGFSILFGLNFLHRANALIMMFLGVSFLFLVIGVFLEVKPVNYTYSDWTFLPLALPVILFSFSYHPVIPSICMKLGGDTVKVKKALLIGVMLPFLLCLLWMTAVLGSLPVENGESTCLFYAFKHNEPATIPLSKALNSSFIVLVAPCFAFAAVFTSFITVGEGLRHFFYNIISKTKISSKKLLTALLTFIPPLLISIIYPHIFLKVLNLAGGVFIVILFGIMPCLMDIKLNRCDTKRIKEKSTPRKLFTYIILIFFISVFVIDVAREIGIMKNPSHVKAWCHPGVEQAVDGMAGVDKQSRAEHSR